MNDPKKPNLSMLALTQPPVLARLDSKSLFVGKREVIIVHQDEEYRLRITRQGKLILTK